MADNISHHAGGSRWLCAAAAGFCCAWLLLAPVPAPAQVPCCMDESELEEALEDEVTEEVEDAVEGDVEERVDENIEDTIEDNIQETIDDKVEATVEESVAGAVEESVEAEVSESVEETVAESVEDSVEESVEESVAGSVEESVEASVEESVAGAVEESVEDNVAQSVEASVTDSVEEATEETVARAVEESVGQSVESSVEGSVASMVEERLETEIDSIVDQLESKLEIDESRINTEQWLVMAEPEVFSELAEQGYLFERVTDLPGMGLLLAEVAAPSSFDISEVRQGVVDVVGTGRAEVDMNHLYTASAPVEHSNPGRAPGELMAMPADTPGLGLRLGMIDSQVDTRHPSLSHARISSKAFVTEGARVPNKHGTAIASILAGRDSGFQGLAPDAELYAAAVFEEDRERGEIASTVSLVRALDWLMSSSVDVVHISLAGPPNRLLERALERAAQRGVLILAAAGNGGPVAAPMYPAAYPSVMAITAVDPEHRVFRLANRGDYLDIAAPGVGLVHADAEGGGYATSSGTSFAVPFAATAAARLRHVVPSGDIRELLIRSAEDLGPPGYDEIYGYGLLRVEG